MQIYHNPPKISWPGITARPVIDLTELEATVQHVLAEVKNLGDEAVLNYTERFDGVRLHSLLTTDSEIKAAVQSLDLSLKQAILVAKANIERFHSQQLPVDESVTTMPGVKCWRKAVAIQKVGLYIPGGTAPLFSTILMLGIPATLAGCSEIVLCTPPGSDGSLHPAILYTCDLIGIRTIVKSGGIQAIGAMSFGTKTVPKVDKIFGPGNQYVTAAKQMVQKYGTAIDMPAGPSEVAIFADGTANPAFVAADLLSQAEHGADSQVLLVTTEIGLIDKVQQEIQRQLQELPRKSLAAKALANSKMVLMDSVNSAMDLLNDYAPEHLILACADLNQVADKVINAGSVFLGNYSPESAGDYASGTNHTLPTNGNAKAYSGVSVDSFMKKITFQQITREGLQNIGAAVEIMAEAEGLMAHKNAVTIRLENEREQQ